MRFGYLLFLLFLSGCYQAERDCVAFKTGTFQSTVTIDSIEYVSTFNRTKSLQIEIFEGKTDSSTVRWINDCEVVFRTVNPKGMIDKKDIHLKILSTTDSSYVFEYNYVGEANRQKGIAKRMN
ncbi:MAG: DNA topoisomerase IV [Flavobacteriaceae bacterium]|nr:DNA topoisomerase IV [Bacteroidia bacterium]MBT8287512.1 DNA topoisomerase IV [Bacteroidia bacterium]NNF75327.1 DNA topoisomerase IV [Flavobacteriaceae bacterium]NNK72078.1 DNA topoisomerase IV [Flavobacteriaceae bacterium]